jgi:hypothetical protein
MGIAHIDDRRLDVLPWAESNEDHLAGLRNDAVGRRG